MERLKNASRYEQAANLILQQQLGGGGAKLSKKDVEQALDCLLKANRFMRAYHLCLEWAPGEGILMNTVKTHVRIAFDLKNNQYVSLLAEFEKRVLRLKVVQH